MTPTPGWLGRLGQALGPAGAARPLGGSAWRVELDRPPPGVADRVVVAKVGPGVGDEAEGLRALGAVAGAPAVPPVLVLDGDLLVTGWVEPGRRTVAQEEEFGRQLAALHAAPGAVWGGGSSWIGGCRVDPAPADDGPTFYAGRLLGLAGRCRLEATVAPVAHRLGDLAPFGAPAPLHGDLWWGNVLWGSDDRPWCIDPSYHGGHPEEDLAMLALFGAVPARLLHAYQEVRRLDHGWEERVALWQLYPLLVHTVLFGGGYRSRAEAAARRYGGR